mmetsp:Transcript_1537/g.4348  ORF Transcript_1537/g.4348 Transcript_1537/m.4348 type:complete len:220 (+) Transcript_1537:902-1561(+)
MTTSPPTSRCAASPSPAPASSASRRAPSSCATAVDAATSHGVWATHLRSSSHPTQAATRVRWSRTRRSISRPRQRSPSARPVPSPPKLRRAPSPPRLRRTCPGPWRSLARPQARPPPSSPPPRPPRRHHHPRPVQTRWSSPTWFPSSSRLRRKTSTPSTSCPSSTRCEAPSGRPVDDFYSSHAQVPLPPPLHLIEVTAPGPRARTALQPPVNTLRPEHA